MDSGIVSIPGFVAKVLTVGAVGTTVPTLTARVLMSQMFSLAGAAMWMAERVSTEPMIEELMWRIFNDNNEHSNQVLMKLCW